MYNDIANSKRGIQKEFEQEPNRFDFRDESEFSYVARMAEKHGELSIFKNNKPKYK